MARLLEDRGWEILERNWRVHGGELDLVVRRHGHLRLVEVKARAPHDPVGLAEAVDGHKQRRLVRAARAFLASFEGDYDEVCFLVALVEATEHGLEVTWIDDAFDA